MRWLSMTMLAAGCLLICACGDVRRVTSFPRRANAPVRTTIAADKQQHPSVIVAHVSARLLGDEDDDDSAREVVGNESHDNDADFDNDYKRKNAGYFDGDDGVVRDFGGSPTPSERKAVVALTKRYFAAAASADGAAACAMTYSVFARAIAEDYGQPPGPEYMRGKTCAVVMAKLFRHAASLIKSPKEIVAIRVSGAQGRVLLGSAATPAAYLRLQLERGSWKVDNLVTVPLP